MRKKCIVNLKGGDIVELSEEEGLAMEIKFKEDKGYAYKVPSTGETIARMNRERTRFFHEIDCVNCGEKYFECDSHICTYKSLEESLDKYPTDSPGLRKLRKQVELMRNGMPGRKAHRLAFVDYGVTLLNPHRSRPK